MKIYKINSPSNKVLTIGADSIYHAIQLAVQRENYTYERHEYFYLNNQQVKNHEAKIKRYKK
jgi:hypothetical protein